MSKKYDAFIADLRSLCIEHDVILTASTYDVLQVWGATRNEIESMFDFIEDHTVDGDDK